MDKNYRLDLLNKKRCSVCFGKLGHFHDYGFEYSHCATNLGHEAWYEDGTKVRFRD